MSFRNIRDDGVQLVPNAAARLALLPSDGYLVEQLNDHTLWAYNQPGNTWVQIGGGGGGGSVNSVTGLNTDNTDPANPIVKISVDGTSITGLGTPGSPLVATGGSPPAFVDVTGTPDSIAYFDSSGNGTTDAQFLRNGTTKNTLIETTVNTGQVAGVEVSDNLFGGGAKGLKVYSSDNPNYIDGFLAGDLSAFGLGSNSTIIGHLDLGGGPSSFDRFYLDSGDGVKETNIKAASGDKLKEVATPAVGWIYTGSGNSSTQLFRLENSDNDAVFTALNDRNVAFNGYPSNRDDTGTFTPVSFLYTDGSGNLLEAPVSALPSTPPALTGNQIGFGDAGTATLTSSSDLTWDQGRKDFAAGDIGNVTNHVKFRVSDNDQEVTIDGFHGIVQSGPTYTPGSAPSLDDIEMLGPYTVGSYTFAFTVDSAGSYTALELKDITGTFLVGDVVEQAANPGTTGTVVSTFTNGTHLFLMLDAFAGSWSVGTGGPNVVTTIGGSGASANDVESSPYLSDTITVNTVGPPPMNLVPMLQTSMNLYGYPLAFASPTGHGLGSVWNASFVVGYGKIAKYDTDSGDIAQGDLDAVTTGLKQTISPSDRSVLTSVPTGTAKLGVTSSSIASSLIMSSDGVNNFMTYKGMGGFGLKLDSGQTILIGDANGNLTAYDQGGQLSGDFNSRKLSNGNVSRVSWVGDFTSIGDPDDAETGVKFSTLNRSGKVAWSEGLENFVSAITLSGGAGIDELSASFSGNLLTTTYTVAIDAVDNFWVQSYTTSDPLFQVGDTVTQAATGASGVVYDANGTYVLITVNAGPAFDATDIVDTTISSTITPTATTTADSFTWDDGATTVTKVPITTSLQNLNNGVSVTFDSATAHSVGYTYMFTVSSSINKLMSLDYDARTGFFGDDAVHGDGSSFSFNDKLKVAKIKGEKIAIGNSATFAGNEITVRNDLGIAIIKGIDPNTSDSSGIYSDGINGTTKGITNNNSWLEYDKTLGLKLFDTAHNLSIDVQAGHLFDGTNIFVDWLNKQIFDINGVLALDLSQVNARRAYSSLGSEVFNWNNTQLNVDLTFRAAADSQFIGNIQTFAGQIVHVRVVAANTNYTLVGSDFCVEMHPSSGNVTATLPASPVTGQMYKIKNKELTINNVIVDGNGKNIDGASTAILTGSTSFQVSEDFIYNGTEWSIY